MLQVKFVVILKANPGILKCGGGIKKWILLCLERKRYLRFGNRMRKIERNIVRQKNMLRESYFIAVSVKLLCYRCCMSSV